MGDIHYFSSYIWGVGVYTTELRLVSVFFQDVSNNGSLPTTYPCSRLSLCHPFAQACPAGGLLPAASCPSFLPYAILSHYSNYLFLILRISVHFVSIFLKTSSLLKHSVHRSPTVMKWEKYPVVWYQFSSLLIFCKMCSLSDIVRHNGEHS